MEENNPDRNLICVLFPGVVKNDEKALQCLGGLRGISQVYSHPAKKRLGLSFQPDNPFIKRIHADSKKTAGVLLKIRVKKTKVNNEIQREVISTKVVGSVKKTYKFEAMCDYQYLPVETQGPGEKPKCIIDDIVPSGLDTIEFMSQEAPVVIIPSHFTRTDRPLNYSYTEGRYPEKKGQETSADNDVHQRRRLERGLPATYINFNLVNDLPVEPHEYFVKQRILKTKLNPQLEEEYETLKKLFDERPIWSQNLLKYHTKFKLLSLKVLVPCLAVYMKDGPWRMLWVKYGYDPRKDSNSRIYQTLDFRLRHQAGVHSMVTNRETVVHYKCADRVRYPRRNPDDEHLPSEHVPEGAVYFRPGMVPAQRQIYYQYCDVKLPEVEEILATPPPPGFLCNPVRGWLPHATPDKCRDHIFRYVKQTLLATRNDDLKYEKTSSDEDSNSDGEGASTTVTETDDTSTKT